MKLKNFVYGIVTFGLLTVDEALPRVMACPMCKAALEEDASKPMAYQTSILFMLAMAMSVFIGMAMLLTYINRREAEALRDSNLLADAG